MDTGRKRRNTRHTSAKRLSILGSSVIFAITSSQSAYAVNEHLVGMWEGPFNWPVVAIHAVVLPDGTVMAYDSVGDHATETYPQNVVQTRAMKWEPSTNSVTNSVTLDIGYNLFCSGLALLSNGHVFIAGGNLNTPTASLLGIPNLTDYDTYSPLTFFNRFVPAGEMFEHRWYPSVTALANGEMVITGGVTGPSVPEVRQTDGTIRQLWGAYSSLSSERIYNWLKQAPDGRVALLGPSSDMRLLNTSGSGSWGTSSYQRLDSTYRDYGSHVIYDIGKAMVTGGATPATASAVTVDLNTMTSAYTANMAFARRQHNLTVLPDGSVLASGGFSGARPYFDFDNAVYPVERWDPRTQSWHTEASMRRLRGYHSIALLLPDGRVLSAGGGICGECQGNYLEKNAEIFSPSYLFTADGSGQRAARPVIASAPNEIAPASQFEVQVTWTGSIKSIALIRLGAVTHSTNMEQRYIPLQYAAAPSGRVSVLAPANNAIAPPGYYMLFVNPTAGAPSVAKIVRVSGGQQISYQAP